MARDLGVKYVCYKCSTKFYDLHKPIPTCPKCGADQRESPAKNEPAAADRKRPRAKRVEEDAPAAVQVADDDDLQVNTVDEEDEDDDDEPAAVEPDDDD